MLQISDRTADTLEQKKCKLLANIVEYLGHVVLPDV